YPVVIAAGEIELTKEEGQRLNQYVENGGTLLVADGHMTGPGVAELKLPQTKTAQEADTYRWVGSDEQPSQRFRYREIQEEKGDKVLATAVGGGAFCVGRDRGKGRLVYLSVPHGLSITKQAIPVLPRLIAHLSRGLMPIEVAGEVQWLVNRTD